MNDFIPNIYFANYQNFRDTSLNVVNDAFIKYTKQRLKLSNVYAVFFILLKFCTNLTVSYSNHQSSQGTKHMNILGYKVIGDCSPELLVVPSRPPSSAEHAPGSSNITTPTHRNRRLCVLHISNLSAFR